MQKHERLRGVEQEHIVDRIMTIQTRKTRISPGANKAQSDVITVQTEATHQCTRAVLLEHYVHARTTVDQEIDQPKMPGFDRRVKSALAAVIHYVDAGTPRNRFARHLLTAMANSIGEHGLALLASPKCNVEAQIGWDTSQRHCDTVDVA
jgi:hypothetical protein